MMTLFSNVHYPHPPMQLFLATDTCLNWAAFVV